ncbi:3-deoxy-manno-octulosonate cytidylyltransferase [bacterium]|nr:3-deoxy-manno-octulosonate cytidylyltransferase [bacterium]
MKVVGVIPARLESKRLPGKPLLPLGGKPIIEWVWENTKRVDLIDELLIATGSEEIKNRAEGFGARVFLTSSAPRSGTERVVEVARSLPADIYLNIQGDEPFLTGELIGKVVKGLVNSPDADVATLAVPATEEEYLNPNVVKLVLDENGFALYFSRSPIPYFRKKACTPLKHIGIYAYRRDTLLSLAEGNISPLAEAESLEQLDFLFRGKRILVVLEKTPPFLLGIDTQTDYQRAVDYVSSLQKD